MSDWLARAKRDFSNVPGQGTANTDERVLTAVTAVPHQGHSEKSQPSNGSNGSTQPGHFQKVAVLPLDPADASRIGAWLDSLDEHDPAIRGEVLDACEGDPDARNYFLRRAAELTNQLEMMK